ncbi:MULTISPECIES: histidine kinase [unclassified Microbulbifer]|uniref:histidine kinase n=1 Tax=unclassified Microbulbifer TaxID=2619833 RepID=UPI0027E3F9F7|nr:MULTISPECIES: histidine kinase [unclassified Microbulbifer]
MENVDEYHLLENTDGTTGYEAIATIDGGATEHGLTVFLPEKMAASYILEACNENGCTESDSVAVSGNLAEAVGYSKASNTEAGDWFGAALALSADGSTLAVAATREDSAAAGVDGDQDDNEGGDRGAVYVFRMVDGSWQQQAYLKSSNAFDVGILGAGFGFGYSLSLSADGNTLAVGAPYENSASTGVNGDQDNADASKSGAVYILAYEEQEWKHQAYVKASNAGVADRFGWSVSLSADGEILAVGASYERSAATGIDGDQNNDDALGAGAVYLFSKDSGEWQQNFYIKASNTEEEDYFGAQIALSGDAQTLAVTAEREQGLSPGVNGDQEDNSGAVLTGAVYVFARGGDSWAQQAYLKSSNIDSSDLFGWSLAISADGSTLAVGARGEDGEATGVNGDQSSNDMEDSGAVYVFERNEGSWEQKTYLKASNTDASDEFGRQLAISADGSRLAVSSIGDDSAAKGIDGDQTDNSLASTGAVYLFSKEDGDWRQEHYIKASNTDAADGFGHSLGLSGDGRTLAVGARREDSQAKGVNGDQEDNSMSEAGAVYLY